MPDASGADARHRYHSDNPNDDILRNWLTQLINNEVRGPAVPAAGLDQPWPNG